ncbi:hypothetical protein GBA65_21220 (plasmid) [Rubrobacter marinus]|uniref:Uncharacterized protein n=1 Tax=Rubrobacter marinus TaxID=2653852 RepID=A0A6G8Q3C4_9ACTN|nr:hypothetical protein [Rubrobacter marinus]QIN80981.1 hypothetical protein GBA65_21220 [Rubrobacter marinus]
MPLLLVVALLLCHGAFGPADRFFLSGSGPAAGHLAIAGSTTDQGGTANSEAPDDYYAVALLLAVGALSWARLARALPGSPIRVMRAFGRRPRPAAPQRSRGPTVFLLQVIRL